MRDLWSNLTKRTRYRIIASMLLVIALTSPIWLTFKDYGRETIFLSYSQFLQKVNSGEIKKVQVNFNVLRGPLTANSSFETTVDLYHVKLADDLRGHALDISYGELSSGYYNLIYPAMIAAWVYFFFWGIGPKGEIYLKFWETRAKRNAKTATKITFDDVAGIDEAKAELEEVVDFLKNPDKFQGLGGKIPKGILLVGPPGNGKTLLARAAAGEAGVPFFDMAGSDFVEMYVGVGSMRVRGFFDKGKAHAPCILFIDEIDALGGERGKVTSGGDREYQQTLNALLVEMDGFEKSPGVVVMAATNRPDVLDPALLRPGRFDRRIFVHLPSANGRAEILKIHARNVPLDDDVDLKELAKMTPGYSGADLANLVNEAALSATRDKRKTVTFSDFVKSKDKISLGAERKSKERTDEDIRTSRYHEAGHAFIAARLKDAERLEKVSIAVRGFTGGVTQFVPSESEDLKLKKINATIVVMMGGRVAEELFLDDISTGAQNDLEHANKYARAMVGQWGMSSLGPVSINSGSQTDPVQGRIASARVEYSEKFKQEVDGTILKIVKNAECWARNILVSNAELFAELVEKFTQNCQVIDGKEIYALVESLTPIEIKNLEDDVEVKTEA